jgi:hypothetical protein
MIRHIKILSAKNIFFLVLAVIIIVMLDKANVYYILKDIEYDSKKLFSGYFEPIGTNNIEIDSTNFSNYEWENKFFPVYDDVYFEFQHLKFFPEKKFHVSGMRIKADRLYFIRKIFNTEDQYQYEGNYVYENALYILEGNQKTQSVQVRDNKLYLNTSLKPLK